MQARFQVLRLRWEIQRQTPFGCSQIRQIRRYTSPPFSRHARFQACHACAAVSFVLTSKPFRVGVATRRFTVRAEETLSGALQISPEEIGRDPHGTNVALLSSVRPSIRANL